MFCLGLGGPAGERALAGLPDPGTRSGHGNIRRAALLRRARCKSETVPALEADESSVALSRRTVPLRSTGASGGRPNIHATSRKVAPGMLSQSDPLGSAPPEAAALLGPPPYQIACSSAGTSTCRPPRSLQAGMREPSATAPRPAVIAWDAAGRAYSTRRRRLMTGYFAAGVRNVGSTSSWQPDGGGQRHRAAPGRHGLRDEVVLPQPLEPALDRAPAPAPEGRG